MSHLYFKPLFFQVYPRFSCKIKLGIIEIMYVQINNINEERPNNKRKYI